MSKNLHTFKFFLVFASLFFLASQSQAQENKIPCLPDSSAAKEAGSFQISNGSIVPYKILEDDFKWDGVWKVTAWDDAGLEVYNGANWFVFKAGQFGEIYNPNQRPPEGGATVDLQGHFCVGNLRVSADKPLWVRFTHDGLRVVGGNDEGREKGQIWYQE